MPRGKKRNNTLATTEAANKRRALAPSESTTNRPQTRSSGQQNKRNKGTGSRDDSTEQADLQDPPSSSPVHVPQPLTREDIPALVLEVVKLLTPALTNAQGTSSSFTGVRESVTGSPAAGTSTNVTTGRGVQGTGISSDRDRSESTAAAIPGMTMQQIYYILCLVLASYCVISRTYCLAACTMTI